MLRDFEAPRATRRSLGHCPHCGSRLIQLSESSRARRVAGRPAVDDMLRLVGIALLVALPAGRPDLMRRLSLAMMVAQFVLTAWLYTRFDAGATGVQFETRLPWIPAWGVYYQIGLDGYNLLPYLTGEVEKSPRPGLVYFSDDGDVLGHAEHRERDNIGIRGGAFLRQTGTHYIGKGRVRSGFLWRKRVGELKFIGEDILSGQRAGDGVHHTQRFHIRRAVRFYCAAKNFDCGSGCQSSAGAGPGGHCETELHAIAGLMRSEVGDRGRNQWRARRRFSRRAATGNR